MVEVRFINDTTPIEVTSDEQETQFGVVSETQATEIEVGGLSHADLSGRDLPDQHTIGAITGLLEALSTADKQFVFEQGIASDTWVINHNLGKRPNVVTVDSTGKEFKGATEWVDDNTVIVRMNGARTGEAYLN
ncbi:MAG: hypothetical protein J6W96_04885 [Alphaproteobacteria bacterium]|nr:hypothetical protein [Alphaproteobacteria bacterium]